MSERFTVCFEIEELQKMKGNPFYIQSPFGTIMAISRGDLFETEQAMREALEAIADGEGDAAVIAQQTLDEVNG